MLHRIVKILAGLSIVLCAAGPAVAAKVGAEFLVNSKALNSSVAPLPGGSFVVVWRGDAPKYPIFGQRYNNSAVKVGAPFNVTPTAPELVVPFVAALHGGGFLVAWDAPDPNGLGVWVQRFNANGVKLGARIRANTFTGDDQSGPTAAGLNNGTFVVTWTSNHQVPGVDSTVIAQRFSASGVKLGAEIRVDTTFANSGGAFHQFPSVAALTNGGFVIVYRGYNGTYARRFNATGGALGDDFRVNLINEGLLQHPVVARLNSGGFVVIREVSSADVPGAVETDIRGQRFNSAGGRVGGDFRVNAAPAGYQLDPAVTGLSNGGFAVTWAEFTAHLCKGRLYNPSGVAVGGNFTVNSSVIPTDARSSVAPQLAGAFVVTYQGSAPNATFAVRGQRFNGQ